MLKVERYTQNDEAKVIAFIRRVQASAEPDEGILSRSALIKDDQEIVGMVSYEPHGNMGVVRYFLYDARIAGTDMMVGLFLELYKKARIEGVKQLIAQIPSCDVGKLFEMLGFVKVTRDLSGLSHVIRKDVEMMLINLEGE